MWQGGFSNEDDLLRNAYWNSLQKAVEKKATTIAFPSISTGAYGFPIERASKIALATVAEFIHTHPQLREVRFVVFSKPDFEVYALLFKDGA
jgi:O-acetyl-ADP-ribose deacetylase (regulator of RNase III)